MAIDYKPFFLYAGPIQVPEFYVVVRNGQGVCAHCYIALSEREFACHWCRCMLHADCYNDVGGRRVCSVCLDGEH